MENYYLASLEMDLTGEKLVNPDFTAEIPCIETEANYKDIVGPQLAPKGNTPMIAQQVAVVCQCSGCEKDVNKWTMMVMCVLVGQ